MILEVPTSDMDHITEACCLIDLNCRFFPTLISGIVKVRISDRGKEISPAIAYRLAVCVEQSKRAGRERILEEELLQEPINDVVITVESIEGL